MPCSSSWCSWCLQGQHNHSPAAALFLSQLQVALHFTSYRGQPASDLTKECPGSDMCDMHTKHRQSQMPDGWRMPGWSCAGPGKDGQIADWPFFVEPPIEQMKHSGARLGTLR